MKLVSKSLAETSAFAKKIVLDISPGKHATVLALYGDLGSGKTTFVQALSRELGISETVQSPTFVIMKRYAVHDTRFKHLIHIDAYRLDDPRELENLGWKDISADPANLIAIEWAERVEKLLPTTARRIHFKFVDETTREMG